MFGNLFHPNRPAGSPFDPKLANRPPLGALGGAQAPSPVMAPPQAPLVPPVPAVAPALPTPPASIKRKRLNMFDREHISQTLMEISKGFSSGGNFLQGVAAAGQNVAAANIANRKAELGTSEIGGPDNAFEIRTDADGNRTFHPIEGVTDYLAKREKTKNAPKPSETATYIGDMSYSISQLPEAQRPGAYAMMVAQGTAQGHDMSSAPPEYSPTYSQAMINQTIGARQGATNAATASYRASVDADRDAARNASIGFRSEASGRANAAAGRSAESHRRSMRKAPPSARKGTNDLDYLK